MVVYACHPDTGEAKAGRWSVWCSPRPHNKTLFQNKIKEGKKASQLTNQLNQKQPVVCCFPKPFTLKITWKHGLCPHTNLHNFQIYNFQKCVVLKPQSIPAFLGCYHSSSVWYISCMTHCDDICGIFKHASTLLHGNLFKILVPSVVVHTYMLSIYKEFLQSEDSLGFGWSFISSWDTEQDLF